MKVHIVGALTEIVLFEQTLLLLVTKRGNGCWLILVLRLEESLITGLALLPMSLIARLKIGDQLLDGHISEV